MIVLKLLKHLKIIINEINKKFTFKKYFLKHIKYFIAFEF